MAERVNAAEYESLKGRIALRFHPMCEHLSPEEFALLVERIARAQYAFGLRTREPGLGDRLAEDRPPG